MKVEPQPVEAAPPSNNRMDRNCDRPGWVYRETRETFTDCTWHVYPECCMPYDFAKGHMEAVKEANGGILWTLDSGGAPLQCADLPLLVKIWCLTSLEYAKAATPPCQYLCCVYVPYGRFCPGRRWPCLACGPTEGCGPQGCGQDFCKAVDTMALSQASIGPGWVAPNLGEVLDGGEEEEPEGERYMDHESQ